MLEDRYFGNVHATFGNYRFFNWTPFRTAEIAIMFGDWTSAMDEWRLVDGDRDDETVRHDVSPERICAILHASWSFMIMDPLMKI